MPTQYIIEFGNRGGRHVENFTERSAEAAKKLCAGLVASFTNRFSVDGSVAKDWDLTQYHDKKLHRLYWVSDTQFVALTKQDGKVVGGPASARLWKKETPITLKETVLPDFNLKLKA